VWISLGVTASQGFSNIIAIERNRMVMQKTIDDLGAGAYYMMHKYEAIGKRGKAIIFEIDEKDSEEFDRLYRKYLNSEFHRFDSCIMSLKKLPQIN
jgi:hypothetical protein